MENTAAVLLPDLMKFRNYVDKDAFHGYHGNRTGAWSKCQQHPKSRWISWWLVIWGAVTTPGWLQCARNLALLFLPSDKLWDRETQTPPRKRFPEHTVLPYKLCESEGTYTLRITRLEMPRSTSVLSDPNWWAICCFIWDEINNHPHTSFPPAPVCFIQSQTHLREETLFNEETEMASFS